MGNSTSPSIADGRPGRSGQADLSRRGFLGRFGAAVGGAATLGACAIGGSEVELEQNSQWQSRAVGLKSNQVYTAAAPGMWAGKEGSHVPKVAINGGVADVSCTHAVAEGHWITTIFVEDQDQNVIHMEDFLGRGPGASQAVTSFRIPPGVTSIVAFAYCNLHDCWSSESIAVPA
jgi:desulfoferrodoxin (superoxide reductase-like protein)